MSRRELENRIFDALSPIVAEEGLQLLDIELTSEGKRSVLRAVIYSPEGITLDDCARVDAAISPKLDEMDPIPDSYNLEVSSPGLERTLRRDIEYEVFKGNLCRVSLFAPYEGSRSYVGLLSGLGVDADGTQVVLLDLVDNGKPSQRLSLDRKNVSKVQLVFSEEGTKKTVTDEGRREKNDK